MKYHVIIDNVKYAEELEDAWISDDFILLLKKFGLEN